MKAIMLSIQPQWVAKILNGEKNIEIRKRFPIDYIGWVYVYCTKDNSKENDCNVIGRCYPIETALKTIIGKGKVVARFWCDNVSRFDFNEIIHDYTYANRQMKLMTEFLKNAQVPYDEIIAYGKGKDLRAIHITKLEIFDTPKELQEFSVWRKKTIYSGMDCPPYVDDVNVPLTRAPQSWQWIEV